jgi:acyl-phosphate glycerol 3-phosphate acyltransferase
MFAVWLLICVALAYLSGSVSYAVLLTHARTGKDIRDMGNKNPGTANVGRSVGKGMAALVLFLDGAKGLVPLIAARILFFRPEEPAGYFALLAVGIAAIFGHIKPVFFGFRGGGGVGTAFFIYLFFVPVEMFACAILAALFALLALRGLPYAFGRWVPIIFITLTPFICLLVSVWIDIPLFAHISIGGHPVWASLGVLLLSVFLLVMNLKILAAELGKMRERLRGGVS